MATADADLLVRAVRQAALGTTGNQTFTATDFAGRTPKGAIFFASGGDTNDVVDSGHRYSIGVTDCTNVWVRSYADQDGEAVDPITLTRFFDGAMLFMETTTSPPGLAQNLHFVSCQADSITTNWFVGSSPAQLITAVLFAGTSVSVHVGTTTISNSIPGDVDVTAPGFPVDLVMVSGTNDNVTAVRSSLGWAHRNGASVDHFTQSIAVSDGNGLPTEVASAYDTTRAVNTSQYVTGTLTNYTQVSVQDFDATGWTYHTEAKASGDQVVDHFALGFTGGFDADIRVVDLPTSAGAGSYSGLPFQPQAVFTMPTLLTAPGFNEVDSGALGFGFGGLLVQASISGASKDNVSPTDTASVASDSIVYMLGNNGVLIYDQSLTSFGSTSVNYTTGTAPGTAYKMGLISISSGVARRLHSPVILR